jgi:hypothetical protein
MSTLFSINFRREAYLQEVTRTRRRVMSLGVWLTYFGVMALALGLYGLNGVALIKRTSQIERQAARLKALRSVTGDARIEGAELTTIDRYVSNPRNWRQRLGRLAEIMPSNARMRSLVINPQNLSSPADQNMLVISGEIRLPAGEDRMRGVMALLTALHDDSLFAAGYGNIRLASTRIAEGAGVAQFTIECR